MKENAKYYSKQAVFTTILAIVYFAFLELILGVGDQSPSDHWLGWMFCNFFCIFMISMMFYKKDIQLGIVMSQTRKNIFVGTLVYTAAYIGILMLESVAFMTVFGFANFTQPFYVYAMAVIGTVLISNAAGILLGICWNVLGKVWAIAVTFAISGLFGISAVVGMNIIVSISVVISQGISEALMIMLICVVVWAGVMVVHRKMIQNYHFII